MRWWRRWSWILALGSGIVVPGATAAGDGTEGIEDFEQLDLEQLLDVVSSAAKHEQDIGNSPSAITLITREDIEATGATTIVDLLRLTPGMEVVLTTPVFSTVGARLTWSFEGQHFLVLIDGREANMEVLGYTPWEIQPLDLDDVERIEVIRGPGSALYGANAVAGVISIVTRAIPDQTSGRVSITGGEVGTSILGARASTRFGSTGVSLSAGGDWSGFHGDPRSLGRDVWRLRALVEHRLAEKKRLLLDAGVSRGTGSITTGVGSLDAVANQRSVCLSYESEDLRGQIYWQQSPIDGELAADLTFKGSLLARFVPLQVDAQVFNGEVQWTVPRFFEPLLLILGGGARLAHVSSDQLLDGDTFANIESPSYHVPGVSHFEGRGGSFVHAELSPAAWLTLTGDLRLDYNSVTGLFLSPRLAAVLRPVPGHFLRLSTARAFRKPSYVETGIHTLVEVPDGGPIDAQSFNDFMTRVVGNAGLDNEEVYAVEAGYLGRFLDSRIVVSLNTYLNLFANEVVFTSNIVTSQGLPDLSRSSFRYENRDNDRAILGSELSLSYRHSRHLELSVSWAYRETFSTPDWTSAAESPKNLVTLGGRFRTDAGLLGSLYLFTRSEFWDHSVYNPLGMLEPNASMHQGNCALLLARLGWNLQALAPATLEAGVKLFLPVDLERWRLRFWDKGGVWSPAGRPQGAQYLDRMLSVYLEGSF